MQIEIKSGLEKILLRNDAKHKTLIEKRGLLGSRRQPLQMIGELTQYAGMIVRKKPEKVLKQERRIKRCSVMVTGRYTPGGNMPRLGRANTQGSNHE